MGVVFWLFSYVSGYIAVLLMALSVSAGLYFLAELAEEFPSITGRVIKYLTVTVLLCQIVLWIDGLPTYQSIIGFCAHLVYGSMLRRYPFVQLYSIQSLLSIVSFFGSNIAWLQYFIAVEYGTLQVLGFYVVVVWSVPCALFISVSLNDNTLPGMLGSNVSTNGLENISGKKKGIFKTLFDSFLSYIDTLRLGRHRKKRLH